MARKSRKNNYINAPVVNATENITKTALVEPVKEAKVYRAGLYARLSFESEDAKERGTIETQMKLLHQFVELQEDIVVEKEYFDISKTGTNFEREGFVEMMSDVQSGRINCIIVKDLSRLGRNYIESGNYVERIFPLYDVRFIAVTDNYDSIKSNEPILVGVSNIFNEMYVRDLSKKVKAGYRAGWMRGDCNSGSIPYGYKRNPDNAKIYAIDEEVAENVRLIFDLILKDKPYCEISDALNEKGALCPRDYKNYKKYGMEPRNQWTAKSIKHILENYNYTGNSVHAQHTCCRIGTRVQKLAPESEWIYVPNTHPAIISMETFNKAQEIMKNRLETYRNRKEPGKYSIKGFNFFKGKIFCADCGGPMYLGRHDMVMRYICGRHHLDRKVCSPRHIPDDVVNNEVLRIIHTHINVYTDNINLIRRINARKQNQDRFSFFGKEIKKLQREMEKNNSFRNALYEDYSSGVIDAEQYLQFKKESEDKDEKYKKLIEELLIERSAYDTSYKTDEEWDALIESFRDKRKLTKQMVDAFVKRIDIDKNGNAIVELVYDDMLEDLIKVAKRKEAANGR